MKITTDAIQAKKGKEKVIALTAYDYTMAQIFDQAGVDILLVGDSVGMVCCGEKDTKSVTIEQMIYHTRAVARGVSQALVIGDMPFHTYDTVDSALRNAQRLVDAGAGAVKIEGANVGVVQALSNEGIPVMSHVGLTPQTAEKFGVRGKDIKDAAQIIDDACALDTAGIFSLVLECVPVTLAGEITKKISVPTIGIGAGPLCDGQVLVSYDLLGMFSDFRPRFVRHFLEGKNIIIDALKEYRRAVEAGEFPSLNESFSG